MAGLDGVLSRRGFLRACVAGGGAIPFCAAAADAADDELHAQEGGIFFEKEARFWQPLDDRAVSCRLCPRHCTVPEGGRGYCGVRENRKGTYYTLVWGNPCSLNLDPIEKKPFYHVLPGRNAFSLATAGCNLKCKFCQNWNISQARPEQTRNYRLEPKDAVALALRQARCEAVAFTYNEPTVFYEYMCDTAALAREKGLKPLVVSNGFMCAEPMKALCQLAAAVKIDLKAFTEEFYEKVTGGELKPVLETIRLVKELGVWLELVNLVIPTLNDSPDDLRALCRWVKKELGPDVPLHFSMFYPMYKLDNLARTPSKTLFDAYDIARAEGLHYVYVGNVRPLGHKAEQTYCPKCGAVVIQRRGYVIDREAFKVRDGKCALCGQPIAGVWK